MELIQRQEPQLPTKIEDLAQFVLVGRDKLAMVRAGIRALDKLDVAEGVRRQKKEEAQMLAEALLDAETRIGEILRQMPKASGKHWDEKRKTKSSTAATSTFQKTKTEAIRELGFEKTQVSRFETLAANKDLVEEIKQQAREADDLPTRTAVLQAVKWRDKMATMKKAEEEKVRTMSAQVKHKPVIHVMSARPFLQTIKDESIDLIITDPPYLTEYDTDAEFKTFVGGWLPDLLDKLKPTGRMFICTGAYPQEMWTYLDYFTGGKLWSSGFGYFNIDAPLIWTYRNTLGQTPKMKYNLNYQLIWHIYTDQSHPLDTSITNEMFSVQDIPAPDGRLGNRYHTWQKPDELANRLIRHASRPGDTVLDCFACTGTFLIAAAKAGRKAIGCEKDPNHANIAKERGCEIITTIR